MYFVPPLFKATNIYYVQIYYFTATNTTRWTLVCADEDLQNFVVHLWARKSGNFDLFHITNQI